MSDERGVLYFDGVGLPDFPEGYIRYPAMLNGQKVDARISTEAFMILWQGAPLEGDLSLLDRFDPGHDAAKAAIEDKFGREGLNDDGGVVVTAEDVR